MLRKKAIAHLHDLVSALFRFRVCE
jgi:hypothetical protein